MLLQEPFQVIVCAETLLIMDMVQNLVYHLSVESQRKTLTYTNLNDLN